MFTLGSILRSARVKTLAAAILFGGAGITIEGVSSAFAQGADRSLITISGIGNADVEPDLATLTAGVITESRFARDALSENTSRMTAVIDAFKAAGIPDKDVQTRNFSVQPQYFHERTENGSKPPKIVAYRVQNEVVVTVRALETLGAVLDRAIDVGANTISGPAFGLSDPLAASDEARQAAANDARRKAQLYAEALGFKLGQIVSINEGATSAPRPPVKARMAVAEAMSTPVPIESGEISLMAQVSVTWEIDQ